MGLILSAESAAPEAGRSCTLPVLAIALVTRSIWAWLVPINPISDCVVYDKAAMNLAQGLGYCFVPGYPTALWPVGTSFLLSLFYRVFGHVYWPVAVFNVGLGVALVGLTMVLAQRFFGSRAALIAGILMAFWPLLIEYTTILASELPFLVAMLLAWVFWSAPGLRVSARAILGGVAIATACYVRPTALLLPVILTIPEVVSHRRFKDAAVQLVLGTIVMLICILPWSFRNYGIFGGFVLISTNAGGNTWMGNSPGSNGTYRGLPNHPGLNELQSDRQFGKEASAYIRKDPVGFAVRSIVKLVRLHDRESIGLVWNLHGLEPLGTRAIAGLKVGSSLYWWAALAFALWGVVVLVQSVGVLPGLFHPTVLIWGYFAAVHAVTVIADRYHMPSIPSIACLAALTLDRSWPSLGASSSTAGPLGRFDPPTPEGGDPGD